MSDFSLTVPVALICFNRPLQTQKVMETLRQARPPRLHVIADGPRAHIAGEAERCAQVRAIATAVDWPCKLVIDFSEKNMGCRDRVISGLNRAFEQSESLIIVEDDCVAHADFFRFCQEMLTRYREDRRVFAVSGNNFQNRDASPDSYYFSRIFHCWGWASWRDRWQEIDFSMGSWPELRNSDWLLKRLRTPVAAAHYHHAFEQTYKLENNSWAYRASFASLVGSLVNILPRVNMVTNIGVGEQATHTRGDIVLEGCAARGLAFPLAHPPAVMVNERADRYTFNRLGGSWRRRVKLWLPYVLSRIMWR